MLNIFLFQLFGIFLHHQTKMNINLTLTKMNIKTAKNPAGKTVTKLTKDNHCLSWFDDKWGCLDVFFTNTDLVTNQKHFTSIDVVQLNILINLFDNGHFGAIFNSKIS